MIIRRLLQHEAIASRRALLGGLASVASVLALGGCASIGATGARYDASSLSVGPDVARRNHAQAGERRADEALVRAGAGFYDDRRTGEAGGAGREPFLSRRSRT